MGREDQLRDAIYLIYEAVLDDRLWPLALNRLADVMQTAHIGFCAMDRHAQSYDSIAPRTDPAWDAQYKRYWAFRNPLWTLSTARPANEIYLLDNLIPREDFAATPVYNEWFRPAGFGLAMMGANLHVGDEISALIAISNAPGKDQITGEQAHVFKAALPHIDQAVRIHRQLRIRDLDPVTAPEKLEKLDCGVILVDGSAKVLYANAWARALLTPGSGLAVKGGYLFSTDPAATLHQLIASCRACHLHAPSGYGGGIALRRSKGRPLRVTVTPLRARGTVPELPWLGGLHLPVAMITISDPAEMPKRPN
jgi:hypothetical protein